MSDSNEPYANPAPDAAQWQGSPVPSAPVPMSPVPMPPTASSHQSFQIPPPPVPQGHVYGHVSYPPAPPAGYVNAASYNTANTYNSAATSKNWMGITSLVLALTTLVFGVTCIPGVILGHMGLAAVKRGEADNRGMALAGLIVSWVFLACGLLMIGLFAVLLANYPGNSYVNE